LKSAVKNVENAKKSRLRRAEYLSFRAVSGGFGRVRAEALSFRHGQKYSENV
jgi:hypothetical protein